MVAVVQADGKFELENTNKRGDTNDLYRWGGITTLGPDTVPDTNTYQGGIVTRTVCLLVCSLCVWVWVCVRACAKCVGMGGSVEMPVQARACVRALTSVHGYEQKCDWLV